MATMNDLIKSYENGAHWVNYGWTKGELALYPVQEKSRNNLDIQSGVNGGKFNKNLKFGINCLGVKPKISSSVGINSFNEFRWSQFDSNYDKPVFSNKIDDRNKYKKKLHFNEDQTKIKNYIQEIKDSGLQSEEITEIKPDTSWWKKVDEEKKKEDDKLFFFFE